MTLVVAAWCSNGIAICADSRSSYRDTKSNTLRIASDATEKLFQVGRVAVGTSGVNSLNGRTIFSHMQDFAANLKEELPSKVADDISIYFRDQYQEHVKTNPQGRAAQNSTVVEFLIVGFEGDEAQAFEAVVIEQAPGDTMQIQGEYGPGEISSGRGYYRVGKSGLTWIGDGDIVECLVLGYNKTILSVFGNQLDAANKVIPTPGFALQDCVNLIYFLTEASERMKHFSAGDASAVFVNRTVGGPIDVMVVRKRSGVTILKKKELVAQSQLGNPPTVTEEDSP